MFELGNIYKSNDSKKSFDYYLKASKYDHNEAQYQLGRCYEIGNQKIDIKPDIEKSIKFYELSSSLGNLSAKHALSNLQKLKITDGYEPEIVLGILSSVTYIKKLIIITNINDQLTEILIDQNINSDLIECITICSSQFYWEFKDEELSFFGKIYQFKNLKCLEFRVDIYEAIYDVIKKSLRKLKKIEKICFFNSNEFNIHQLNELLKIPSLKIVQFEGKILTVEIECLVNVGFDVVVKKLEFNSNIEEIIFVRINNFDENYCHFFDLILCFSNLKKLTVESGDVEKLKGFESITKMNQISIGIENHFRVRFGIVNQKKCSNLHVEILNFYFEK